MKQLIRSICGQHRGRGCRSSGSMFLFLWQESLHMAHCLPGLVNIQKHTKTMEHYNFSWLNQLFLWPFSISMLVYQRVNVFIFPKLSKGGGSKPINYNKDPEKLAILGHTGGFDQSHIGWNYIIIWIIEFSSCYKHIYNIDDWLVVWNMAFIFHSVWKFIIPTDKLIFFRGVGIPPTRLLLTIISHFITI